MQQKNPDTKGYPEFNQLDLPAIEKYVLKFWEENRIFEKSVSSRPDTKRFIFYEGPPSANGKPGIHHVMSRTIKDLFCRFKTLQGYKVERKAGWDTHGLPVELGVEKQLGITKADIGTKISVEEYNKLCREDVMKFTDVWRDLTTKMAYWVDMDHPYVTYENNYIESLWAILKMLYDKGLLYEGYTIQPYSPAAGTGLSSHELNQPGCYRNVKDVSAIAMFKVIRDEKSKFLFEKDKEDVRFLAWTTTPWTLPSNTALAVGGNIRYVKAKTLNFYSKQEVSVILAADLLEKTFEWNNLEVKEAHDLGQGAKLQGIRYEQLLPYVQPAEGDAFKVVTGDFVTTTDGTGIVHIAPSFGADDFKVARQNGLGALTLVDKQGKFVKEVNDPVFPLSGSYVKEDYYNDEEKFVALQEQKGKLKNIIPHLDKYLSVDDMIVLKLKLENKLFKTEKYEHNYPHCWRTDKPVIYYPLDSWFIKTTAYKEKLIALNKTINWKPAHTGEGRFGQWLENLVDWNLSRSRYWGTPLPIWKTEDGSEELCIGSIDQLYEEVVKAKELGHNTYVIIEKEVFHNQVDLHKPLVDEIVLVSKSGRPMYRVPDLIDVWFDSGAMPYAQWHWPFGPPAPEGGEESEVEKDTAIRWKTANPLKYKLLKEFAMNNRREATRTEEILWTALSGKKLSGYKFRRQHIIEEAIVDFVCITKKLVVEVDGGYHNTTEQQELDKARTDFLNELGYKVIRFTNDEVIGNVENVLNKIQKHLASRPTVPKEGYNKAPFGGLGAGCFPADFIAEGVDQTRGWFFTLHVLGVMLFDSVTYKNVVSNGLLLDKNGNKMSKRLGNVIDPFETIKKYSADATRWYMMRNSDPWDNMKFDFAGLQDVIRSHFGTLYNTYSFFALYANIDKWTIDQEARVPYAEKPELDRWIISKLQSLVKEVTAFYEDYEPTRAARAIEVFVDQHLSNWYVRLSRRRFWKGEASTDKNSAYETLHDCLFIVAQLMSPVSPFFSEWLYRSLTSSPDKTLGRGDYKESIHLTYLVQANDVQIDKDLEERMELAQQICSLVLSLRKKEKIKVRQPLQKIMIPVANERTKGQLVKVESYILSEVNVKAVEYITDTAGIVRKKIKPNFRELGKRAGAKMKALQTAISSFSQADLQKLESEKVFELKLDDEIFKLDIGDVEILNEDIPGWLVASEGPVTVALDVTMTDELLNEGAAREFVNKVQNLRKDKDFQVLDRIRVSVVKNKTFESALSQFRDYISNEILAREILLVDSLSEFDEVELNEEILKVKVELN